MWKKLKKIREKYAETGKNDKIDELRMLENKITRQASLAGIGTGLSGTVLLAIGLTLVLTLGNYVAGIPLGVAGIGLMASATSFHKIILKKLQKKNAAKIIDLADKLLGEN